MRYIIILTVLIQISFAQEIFETFDLEGSSKYLGKTVYSFNTESGTTPVLNVSDIMGDIYIKGVPGVRAKIKEIVKVKSNSKKGAKALHERFKSVVTYSKEDNVISIKGKGPWSSRLSFDYEITIPQETGLMVSTSGGDIAVEHISSEIDMKTSGGDLDFSFIKGKLTGFTAGGDIDLNHCQGTIYISTAGGDIDAVDIEGKINANTSGGDVDIAYTEGELSINTSGGDIYLMEIEGENIIAKTSAGDIQIEDVNSPILLHTDGGDIDIKDVNGNIKATTAGGDIELYNIAGIIDVFTDAGSIDGEDIAGPITAITKAGDIYIEKIVDPIFIDHSIMLRAEVGDIQLILPENFSGEFQTMVENAYSSDAIESEFPITIIKTMDDIRGEGIIGAGVHVIKIRTQYGEIYIEKTSVNED